MKDKKVFSLNPDNSLGDPIKLVYSKDRIEAYFLGDRDPVAIAAVTEKQSYYVKEWGIMPMANQYDMRFVETKADAEKELQRVAALYRDRKSRRAS
jgi:hypothetical protein